MRIVFNADWNDAAHISDEAKEDLLKSIQPYQREARMRGIPTLGAGAIYPFSESDISVNDIEGGCPKHWPRGFGMDCALSGVTAIVWGAWDRETDTVYIYSVYRRSQAETAVHVEAIKARGLWIPGVGDASAILDADRNTFLDKYKSHKVNIELPDKSVESGISSMYDRFSAGKLKIFKSCRAFFEEFRLYNRDQKGKVIKKNDHCLDACFGPGTRIMTSLGPIAIDDLCGVDGEVLTIGGARARYLGARKTLLNTPVITLKFDDGSKVTCTYDHPFLTPNGWRRADAMAGFYCYNGISQRIQWTQALSSLLRPVKTFAARSITCVVSIFNATASACIGWSGVPLMARFQPVTTSTIAITTDTTTPWTISSAKKKAGTSETTSRESVDLFRKPLWMPRRSGTVALKALSGIVSIWQKQNHSISTKNSCATSAEALSRRCIKGKTDSAQITVGPRLVGKVVSTMKNVLASSAATLLWRISTFRRPAAREAAVLKCLGAEDAGTSDVYCLTVPGTSAFVLENGAVVHNTRYLVHSGLQRMKVQPVVAEEDQYIYEMGGHSQGQGWMR